MLRGKICVYERITEFIWILTKRILLGDIEVTINEFVVVEGRWRSCYIFDIPVKEVVVINH